MFCNVDQLKQFLNTSDVNEIESLKKQLCSDVWSNYIADMIQAFGVSDVKDNVNITLFLIEINYSIAKIISLLT